MRGGRTGVTAADDDDDEEEDASAAFISFPLTVDVVSGSVVLFLLPETLAGFLSFASIRFRFHLRSGCYYYCCY